LQRHQFAQVQLLHELIGLLFRDLGEYGHGGGW
jgi:hypothetical protein